MTDLGSSGKETGESGHTIMSVGLTGLLSDASARWVQIVYLEGHSVIFQETSHTHQGHGIVAGH